MERLSERSSAQTARSLRKPRCTNSGVSNALGIDWSTWSKPNCNNMLLVEVGEVLRQFRTNNEKAWWGHGYTGWDVASYGSCVWRADSVLVDLPGRAMEYIRHFLKIPDRSVCQWFIERGFKATRLDLALDTEERNFNPFVALKAWHRGLVRCYAQRWDFRLSQLQPGKPILPPDGKGMTTYVGSPRTGRRLRIYDKVTEALEKHGEVLTDGNGREIPHLTRLELQHRDEAAAKAARLLASEGLDIIPELIGDYVAFLSHRDPRQRERKRVASWWQRIVGNKKRPLELARGAATPDDSIFWIKKQAVITLKLIQEKAPDIWERIRELVNDAEVRAGTQSKWNAWAVARNQRKAEAKEAAELEHEERVLDEICYGESIYFEDDLKRISFPQKGGAA